MKNKRINVFTEKEAKQMIDFADKNKVTSLNVFKSCSDGSVISAKITKLGEFDCPKELEVDFERISQEYKKN